jgi:hypothetical protein
MENAEAKAPYTSISDTMPQYQYPPYNGLLPAKDVFCDPCFYGATGSDQAAADAASASNHRESFLLDLVVNDVLQLFFADEREFSQLVDKIDAGKGLSRSTSRAQTK